MSKHTPGPWIRKGENVWNDVEMMYHAAPNFDAISPSQVLIANAKLIAAAPDLLASVKELLNCIDSNRDWEEAKRARAALTKVES